MADLLEHGPSEPRRRPPRWLVAAIVVVLAGAAAGYGLTRSSSSGDRTGAAHTPSGSASVTSGPTAMPRGHPLPRTEPGWVLYARARPGSDRPGKVFRFELSSGRTTATTVPGLRSGGPVSFLAAPHQVLIRPLDYVPGYVVPDGRGTRKLSGPLAHGGPVLPGPELTQVWVPSKHDQHRMRLVTLDGHGTGTSVRVSTGNRTASDAVGDGAGYIAFQTDDGVYDIRPSGRRRVSTGSLLAVGPTAWLTRTCRPAGRCKVRVVDPVTGDRRVLHAPALARRKTAAAGYGAISPDGTTAALVYASRSGAAKLHLLDLRTGADHRPKFGVYGSNGDSARDGTPNLIWTPDSRWVFTIDDLVGPLAIDRRTRHVRSLGRGSFPPVTQLAFRDGS